MLYILFIVLDIKYVLARLLDYLEYGLRLIRTINRLV